MNVERELVLSSGHTLPKEKLRNFIPGITQQPQVLKRIEEEKSIQQGPVLGISVTPVSGGFEITKVADDSAASVVDLQTGDVVTHADGRKLKSFEDLRSIMSSKDYDDTISLSITRSISTRGQGEMAFTFEIDVPLAIYDRR